MRREAAERLAARRDEPVRSGWALAPCSPRLMQTWASPAVVFAGAAKIATTCCSGAIPA